MLLKESQQIENKAKEVWVVSPQLYYDVNEVDYPTVVNYNLNRGVVYRYIIPGTDENIEKIESFKERFGKSEDEIKKMFLLLSATDLTPFMSELAIYNPGTDGCTCSLTLQSDCCMTDEVIRFDDDRTVPYVDAFKSLWKTYKREDL